MSIRWRLLGLLLVTSLAPLVIVSVFQLWAMRRLGGRLAAETRQRVIDEARRHLLHLLEDFTEAIEKEGKAIELAVRIQAREVERLLAAAPPEMGEMLDARKVDWSKPVPEGMEPSKFHKRMLEGKLVPMPVAFDKQIYFLPAGVNERDVRDDLARLCAMTKVYQLLHKDTAGQIYWQYTALESGLHTSYPSHGPLSADFDPRQRQWYKMTKQDYGASRVEPSEAEVVWSGPVIDASSQVVTIAASLPVYYPDGRFAGVTSIDMPITHVMDHMRLPDEWEAGSKKLLVGIDLPEPYPNLLIWLQQSYQKRGYRWDKEIELEALRADDPRQTEEVIADLRADKSVVREVGFQGRLTFWGYGKKGDYPAAVIIVQADSVVAPADRAQRGVLDDTRLALRISSAIWAVVLVAVVITGLARSRKITRPVQHLAAAAGRIAQGDFRTRVDIGGRDELHRLGEAFNNMTAGLGERDRLKASLATAMEIQQHLLPQEEPKIEGFDIVGKSLYCDETGGDYYDFIQLVKLTPDKLGIALGDVTGHGISAALLMASARAVLRSHAGVHGDDLSKLFEDINAHLVRDTGDERFVTLFYGVLDGSTKRLCWASAGHDPALWIHRAEGTIEELPNTGIPLGVIEETTYGRGGPVEMKSGDVIVIGTDGIWEAADQAGELFGKGRLKDVIKASADCPAAEICNAITRAVAEFRGPLPQTDDITLVVMKAL